MSKKPIRKKPFHVENALKVENKIFNLKRNLNKSFL